MRSIRTDRFKALYDRLPEIVQREADEAYQRFKADPNHPGLNFKRIQGTRSPLVRTCGPAVPCPGWSGWRYVGMVLDRLAR